MNEQPLIRVLPITPNPVRIIKVGTPGPPGASVEDGIFLATAARLAEFATPEAKADARQNLELQIIDLGTFN